MSDTIEITRKSAIKAHGEADKAGKKLLENLLGADNLKPKSVMDRIKSYEDACEDQGIAPGSDLPYPGKDHYLNDYQKMVTIAKSLNEGWTPDWSNGREYKYYPWFEWKGAGFGFSSSYSFFVGTGTSVGSRLCFKSRELAVYAGKQFQDLYNQFMQIK
jgi:hypothetical protein